MKRCKQCEANGALDTTCRTCWPKMVIIVEKDNLASINHVLLKAGVKYTANEGDTIISHQRVNDKDIDFNPGESFVAAPEDRAMYNGLMAGDNVEFKPVRYPLDDKGIIDNALINQGGE